jgi:hypothetical protein
VKAYEVTNMLIDIVILSLPVRSIKSLHLPTSSKIGAAFIFLLGGFILIICAIRTNFLAKASNRISGEAFQNGLNWSTAELGVAVACACIPVYGPYIQFAGHMWTKTSSWLGSRTQESSDTSLHEQSTKITCKNETLYSQKKISSSSFEHGREDVRPNSYDTEDSW